MALAQAGFTLSIRSVSTLRPHEETIPVHVEKISAQMMHDGVQKDPMIIDRESGTVLDGMHRLAAFSLLRVNNAVCCSVDYSSKSVNLRRWARVYTTPRGDAFGGALERAGMGRRVTLAEALDALEGLDSGLAALAGDAAYLPTGPADLEQAFRTVSVFDKLAEEIGWVRRFLPEDDIDVPLQEKRNLVVLVRRLRKDDVVRAATTGRLFPCKTSMHLIDPRPVAVNFPLAGLNAATNVTLREHLKGRREHILPADSLYEGRRYKERLLLLNPS